MTVHGKLDINEFNWVVVITSQELAHCNLKDTVEGTPTPDEIFVPESPPQYLSTHNCFDEDPDFGQYLSTSDCDDEPLMHVSKKEKVTIKKLPNIKAASSKVQAYVGERMVHNTKWTPNTSIRRLCNSIFKELRHVISPTLVQRYKICTSDEETVDILNILFYSNGIWGVYDIGYNK